MQVKEFQRQRSVNTW